MVVGSSNDPNTNAAYIFLKPVSGVDDNVETQRQADLIGLEHFRILGGSQRDKDHCVAIGNSSAQNARYVFDFRSLRSG